MSGLIEYLSTDPEIISLRNRFKEVTGEWCPYHWEEFGSIENYKKYMQAVIFNSKCEDVKMHIDTETYRIELNTDFELADNPGIHKASTKLIKKVFDMNLSVDAISELTNLIKGATVPEREFQANILYELVKDCNTEAEFFEIIRKEKNRTYRAMRWHSDPGANLVICSSCKHRYGKTKCVAFPDGIPREILIMCEGDRDINQPCKGNIRYEKR